MGLTWNLSAYLFRAVGAESVGLHINNLELKAVFQALQGFQSHILNKCVRLLQMNSKEVGTHSPSLCICMGAPMLVQSSEYNYSGSPNPRKLNVLVDSLSRPDRVLPTEWSLNHRIQV